MAPLPRDHTLIHIASTSNHGAIHWDAISRVHFDNVANRNQRCINKFLLDARHRVIVPLLFLTAVFAPLQRRNGGGIGNQVGLGRSQLQQFNQGRGRATAGFALVKPES